MAVIDISGQRFGSLTAIERIRGARPASYFCLCDCGTYLVVRTGNMKSGNTKSCGCRVPDVACGWTKTPEYTAFRNAKNRCERVGDKNYPNYGGRGIEFRFATMNEFIAAVGPRPSPRHSIDRIDNDGHYALGNVRWADRYQQSRNKRSNVKIEINGDSRCLKEWCQITGAKYKKAHARIKAGWPAMRAIEYDRTILTIEQIGAQA